MGEKQYGAEEVLAAAFAKQVMDDADAQGWLALDTLRSWCGALEGSEALVARMRKKYAKGHEVLQGAQLIIGNPAPYNSFAARAHRASVVRGCPYSAIVPAVGGHRAGRERVRHIGLRTRKGGNAKILTLPVV